MANYFQGISNAMNQADSPFGGQRYGSPQVQPTAAPSQGGPAGNDWGFGGSPGVNPATGIPYAQAPGAMGPQQNYFNPGSFNMSGNDMTPFQAAGPQPGGQFNPQQSQILGNAMNNMQQQNAARYQPVAAPPPQQAAPPANSFSMGGTQWTPAPAAQAPAATPPATQMNVGPTQTPNWGQSANASNGAQAAPASGGMTQWDPSNPSASQATSGSASPAPNRTAPNYFGASRGTSARPSSF